MENLVRLLLRFVLIPLGYLAAVIAGTLVILFGSWKLGQADMATSEGQAVAVFGYVFAGPVLLITLLSVMWMPAAIGVLFAEAFAVRSWMFHAANGAAAAWIGWSLFGYVDDSRTALNSPLAVIAAGLAGGLAYWLIAGWSAGFWKPVFGAAEPPPAPAQNPQIR
jgi:hypothetical protein